MIAYSHEQLATIVALPTITTLLIWTIAIFHKNRKKWGPYDIPIISVLVLSVIRNITVLVYVLVVTLGNENMFNVEYCSVVVWIFNSLHTFQASSLTTIAVIGLFSVKLHQKQQNLRMFLTSTHIIYHLFCLTTLCACVGVAAILAQSETEPMFERLTSVFDVSPCRFMPFNLDIKYNVFILVLHLFLAVISFSSFGIICYNFYKIKKENFEYIKKSNSDLSEMSLGYGNTFNGDNGKGYYDTYTINRTGGAANTNVSPNGEYYYDAAHPQTTNSTNNGGFYGTGRDINWNSDLSTTVSSTNSRRPCLGRQSAAVVAAQEQLRQRHEDRTGLETMHPVLIVCYLFYHLPLIILCIYPKLIHPWPVTGIALWLGLVQDLLIPIGLGIVDSRFCKWVSNVYRCSGKKAEEKLPQVGLDGKFRPFGTYSQPQSLDIHNSAERNLKVFQAVEHRFPITNGSLYTSIDGRLPVIHNYRRNKENRSNRPVERQFSNVALHSSHLNRQDYCENFPKVPSCSNCEADLCPSHSNLHHLSPQYINKQLNLLQQQHPNPLQRSSNLLHASSSFLQQSGMLMKKPLPDRVSYSQESLNYLPENQAKDYFYRNSDLALSAAAQRANLSSGARNLLKLNNMRLTKSEDSLDDLQIKEFRNIVRHSNQNASKPKQPQSIVQQKRGKNYTKVEVNATNGYSSSDDDYVTDVNDVMNNNENFDSISSKSCYSITTEANGDFEFFQNKERVTTNVPLMEKLNCTNNKGEYFIINNASTQPVMTSFKPIVNNFKSSNQPVDVNKNFRITRSNSKRSLENFQAFVEVESVNKQSSKQATLHRSNSFITLDAKLRRRDSKKSQMSDSKLMDISNHHMRSRTKMKSVEYLPDSGGSAIFVDHCYDRGDDHRRSIGSVPDLKKVFISEYI